jgi:hypothetical protein
LPAPVSCTHPVQEVPSDTHRSGLDGAK